MDDELVAGRYRIEREIGRGGGGSVWLALDERLGRRVALKRIHAMAGEDRMEVARGMREARTAAALQHEHVVAVHDVIETGGSPWLVMEYVDGPSMLWLIERDGRLPEQQTVRLGAQVASALSRAHREGIIHRDIKPANILVADGGRTAKLADFGIARAEQDEQLTAEGLTSGTALYFSPELARGAEPSPASDVWALGATLYYAVEGRPPVLDAGSQLATLNRIASTTPAPPQHAGPLASVLAGMLDASPRTRLTMDQVYLQLTALQDGRRLNGPSSRFSAETSLQTAPLAVGPAAPVASTGGWVSAAGPAPAGDPWGTGATAASPPARTKGGGLVAALSVLLVLAVAAAVGVWWMSRTPATPAAVTSTTTQWETATSAPPTETTTTGSSTTTTSTTSTPPPPSVTTVTVPADPSPSSSSETESDTSMTASARESFANVYLVTANDDQDAAWEMTTDAFRATQPGGRAGYDKWWGETVESVEILETKATGKDGVKVKYKVSKAGGGSGTVSSTYYLKKDSGTIKLDRAKG